MPYTSDEIERYEEIQAGGLPPSRDIISIKRAAELFQVTFPSVSNLKARNPGTKEHDRVTWWIVGSMIMLDKASLFKVARNKGWIEEVMDNGEPDV